MSGEKPFSKVGGRLARSLKAGRLTGAVGGSYLGGKLLDRFKKKEDAEAASGARHRKNARRIVETLSELRGPMMKIGQLFSTHADALPAEYQDILGALQSEAPSIPYADVARQIEAELDGPPEAIFTTFEREAFAAASIGQVHRATAEVRGEGTVEVAVKVQYPGAESMVESDLGNLGSVIHLVKGLGADVAGAQKLDFTPVLEEIGEHMRQETDYCREAFNAQLMRRALADHPSVEVPRVFTRYSGFRVITYEFMAGVPLTEFLASKPSEAERTHVTQALARSFWSQIFESGIMHADPHPGNYLIDVEREGLALLDFGCVKIFSEAWVIQFTNLVRAYITGDTEAERAAIVALELVDDPDDVDAMADMRRIGRYFSAGLMEDAPFRFGAAGSFDYAAEARSLIEHFISAKRVPRSQRDFFFLTRVALGLYEYFSQLDCAVNYHAIAWPLIKDGWQGRKVEVPEYYLT